MKGSITVLAVAALVALLPAAPASAAGCADSAYSQAVSQTAGVVGYWRLGESSGATACDALGVSPGTYTGGVTLGRPGAISGDTDTAAALDGTGAYVSVPDAARFDVGDSFTAEAWVKRGQINTAANGSIVSKSSSWLVMINTANQIALRKSNAGDAAISTATITDTTKFHHIVATKNGASVHLYLDGVDVTGTVTSQTMANTTEPVYVGRSVGGSYFNGTVDEPAVYNSALTAAQVQAHYQAGTDPVIMAAGDIACDPASAFFNGGAGTATDCRQRAVSDLLMGRNLADVLTLGDHQYEEDTLAKYAQVFDPTWGRVKSLIHPAIGNHEYQTPGATGYFDYFNGVGQQTGPAGDRTKAYYSFDLGTWHIVALNSNCAQVGGCDVGSVQNAWLQADLAAHPSQCTLAYFHHPRFTQGPPGNNSEVRPLWDALYAANAEVVLGGHSHTYERYAPQTPTGVVDTARGLREFVVGTGGKSHHAWSTTLANSQVRNNTTYGALELTLHAGSFDWRFVPEAGATFTDSGSQTCH